MDKQKQEEILERLSRRRSVRAFKDEPIDPTLLKELEADITFINTHEAGLHFSLVINDPKPFATFSRSYGSFRNVKDFLACTVDRSFPEAIEKAGFYAEEFVMKCVDAGLGTCIVGGTFDSSKVNVQLRPDWHVPFVVVFGVSAEKEKLAARMLRAVAHMKKMSNDDFFLGTKEELERAKRLFPDLPAALQALAYAPSALNKRPVRISLSEKDGKPRLIAVTTGSANKYTPIDLGVAKYNIGCVLSGAWEWGDGAPFIQDE